MNLFKCKYVVAAYLLAWAFGLLAFVYSSEIASAASSIPHIFGHGSEWFWTMAQAIVVGVTLPFIYFQLKAQHSKNMLDTIAVFDDRWNSEEMRNSRRALCSKYAQEDFAKLSDLEAQVLDFFEHMGFYLKKGVYSKDVIWEFYSYHINNYWQIALAKIEQFQKDEEDSTYYAWFKYLHEEMLKESSKRRVKVDSLNKQKMERFINDEINGHKALREPPASRGFSVALGLGIRW